MRAIVAIIQWLRRGLTGARKAIKPSWQLARSRFGLPWRIQSPYRALLFILVLFFALGGGLIAGMYNIRTEIVEGPNRPLQQVASTDDSWLLQKGATNLVDDSFVPVAVIDQLRSDGYQASGFTRNYRAVTIDGEVREAMVLDTPAPLTSGDQGVVVDETLGASIGGKLLIGGHAFTVTGIATGSSALGKEGVFLSPENYHQLGGPSDLVSGVFIKDGLPSSYRSNYAVYTAPEFEQLNYEYWETQGGSLPILVAQLVTIFTLVDVICLLALGFALTRKTLVMMRAVGATTRQVMLTDLLYLCLVWAISLPFQGVAYWYVVGTSKAQTHGYLGALTLGEFAWGSLSMLGVIVAYIVGMSFYVRRTMKNDRLAGQLRGE